MFTEFIVKNKSARELLKNTTEGPLIPIVINNDTGIFMLQSYLFECLICMKAWNAEMNDLLQCKIAKNNEFDSLVVSSFAITI